MAWRRVDNRIGARVYYDPERGRYRAVCGVAPLAEPLVTWAAGWLYERIGLRPPQLSDLGEIDPSRMEDTPHTLTMPDGEVVLIGRTLRLRDAWPGVDVVWQVSADGVKERVHISAKARARIRPRANRVRLIAELDLSAVARLTTATADSTVKTLADASGPVQMRDGAGDVIATLLPSYLLVGVPGRRNGGVTRVDLTRSIYLEGGRHYVSVELTGSQWNALPPGPLVIDPSWSARISNTLHDGYSDGFGEFTEPPQAPWDAFYLGYDSAFLDGGWIWRSTDIPQGAEITAATVTLTRYADTRQTVTGDWWGYAVNSPTNFSADHDTHRISDHHARTTASVAHNFVSAGSGTLTSPDLASVVQEIVDRAGYAGDLGLTYRSTNPGSDVWQQWADYSDNTAHAALLSVEWADDGPGTDELTAQNLTAGTPAIDQATIGQAHSLGGQDVTAGTPAVDQATLSQQHALGSQSVDAGVPQIEQASLDADRDDLEAQDITAGSPTIDQATIAETHALTSQDLTAGQPAIQQVTIGQTHSLAAPGIDAGAPSIEQPTISQVHALTSQHVAAGTPEIEQATLSQHHELSAQSVTAGTPTIDQATLAEAIDHLGAQDLTTGTPTVEQASISQAHVLAAQGVTAGQPVIDQATLLQHHGLTAQDLTAGAPTVDQASVAETVALLAQDLTAGVPTIEQASLVQVHALAALNVEAGAVEIGLPDLSQHHLLTAQDVETLAAVIGAAMLTEGVFRAPEIRTLVVRAERRRLTVAWDERSYTVPPERRTVKV